MDRQAYKIICNTIYSIGVLTLCGFLCWYFKSYWGCLTLLLLCIKDEVINDD